jgi:hypothetical protein
VTPRTPSKTIDALIVETSKRHDGLIPVRLLRDCGISTEAITHRRESGLLVPVQRDVLASHSVAITPERRALAAVLSNTTGHPRWISHLSALHLHQATLRRPPDRGHVASIDAIRIAGIEAHRCAATAANTDLQPYFHGLVSRPWRALVESASLLDEAQFAVALDSLVQNRKCSLARVQRCVVSYAQDSPNFRGQDKLSVLLNERVDGVGMVRSFLEHDLAVVLRRAKLPQPVHNHQIRLPNGKTRILDVAWPHVKLCLEAESWKYHSSTSDWGRSRTRDRELSVAGWMTLAVVVQDIRQPTVLITHLQQAFAHLARQQAV